MEWQQPNGRYRLQQDTYTADVWQAKDRAWNAH
jgi:hypothetical protein